MFKNVEKTSVNMNSSDLFVSAIVQRLAVLLVFKFVNRMMVSGCGYPFRAQPSYHAFVALCG